MYNMPGQPREFDWADEMDDDDRRNAQPVQQPEPILDPQPELSTRPSARANTRPTARGGR